MQNKLKSRVRTPKAASPASEIARLKIDFEQERVKSERYRLAAESAKNLIYEWDLGSRVEWLGQVDELLGYQPNEIPRTWEGYTRLLNPEDRERVLAAVEKQLKADEPYSVECRVRRKDGTYLYWQDRGSVVRDESGKPVKWLGAVSDITERKRAELALKSLTARQEAILAATPAIIMEVDNNRIYTWSNQEGLNFFGEDVVGKEAASFFEGEQKTYETVQPVFEGHEDVIYIESWQRRIDGQKRLLAWRCRTLKDEFGNVKGALSTADDITERTLAEGKLVKSEAQLSNALKMAHAGHWEYDVDQDIFTFNDNFYRIFRTTAADVGGYQMSSAEYARRFCHPDDAAAVGNETWAAIESADPNYSRQIEHRILYADGEIGSITVRFFIVKDAHGRTVKTYGVNQDITDRKKAEERLLETLQSLRKAYGGIVQVLSIASEVRDPYTAGHQKRVADLARSIAQEMGLAPECVEGLRLAGNIHDIGKLSIPAEILSKPTRLSKIEFSLIQSHAQIGHDILKDIDFAWPIARIIHQHHERLDGSGYPQGLKDGDILLESRILAVADVIEAMASHRPYRPSLGIDAAIREIESGKGILFDPAVVSACLTLFREKGYIFKD